MAPRTHSHVTSREAQAVCDFAIDVLALLNMPSWQVLVMEEPADDDCVASILPVEGKYTAQLYLASDWMKRTEDERCETVVHEMLHLLHFRINHVFDDAAEYMHDHEQASLGRRYRRETELMVDHLAKFLSRTHTMRESWDTAHGRKP